MRIDEDGHLGLAEHVNKAGRDHLPVGVDGAGARRAIKIPDSSDAALANADLPGVPGRTGAVDDVPVGDDDVKGYGRWGLCGGGERSKKKSDGKGKCAHRSHISGLATDGVGES